MFNFYYIQSLHFSSWIVNKNLHESLMALELIHSFLSLERIFLIFVPYMI